MSLLKIAKFPYLSLGFNILYALGNSTLGFLSHSWWFITVGAYYAILAVTRFSVLQVQRKAAGDYETECFARKLTGFLLIALSFCIVGVNILSALKERGTAFHEILMITIATYTFTKITLAIIGMVKASHAPALITLRNIALADAFVSIYTMQRSMLVSFPGMEPKEIQVFNILTGTAVWLLLLLLGINLIGGKYTEMAKSKLIEANKKIANATTEGFKKIEKGVVDGYKKIEKGVVDGYKKIEKGVVDGYTKIEDRFVEPYLTKDGETVEEAKERLKKGNK